MSFKFGKYLAKDMEKVDLLIDFLLICVSLNVRYSVFSSWCHHLIS